MALINIIFRIILTLVVVSILFFPTAIYSKHTVNGTDTTQMSLTILQDNTQIRNNPTTESEIIYFANQGEIVDIISESDHWYKVRKKKLEGFIHKKLVDAPNVIREDVLRNKRIVIDAGHGGRDNGAIGVGNTLEKEITYRTAVTLAQKLTWLGAKVELTRNDDEYISLSSRAALSNIRSADVFISLHYNSFPDLPSVSGIGTYYYRSHHKTLANFIQKGMIQKTKAKDRGISFGDFQVIRQNLQPSILIELGFISNPEKESILVSNEYQEKMVNGIIHGLKMYFLSLHYE